MKQRCQNNELMVCQQLDCTFTYKCCKKGSDFWAHFLLNCFACECKRCIEKGKNNISRSFENQNKPSPYLFPWKAFHQLGNKVKAHLASLKNIGNTNTAMAFRRWEKRTELPKKHMHRVKNMFWSALPMKSCTVCCQSRACATASSWQCSLIAISPCVMPRLCCHVKLHL